MDWTRFAIAAVLIAVSFYMGMRIHVSIHECQKCDVCMSHTGLKVLRLHDQMHTIDAVRKRRGDER